MFGFLILAVEEANVFFLLTIEPQTTNTFSTIIVKYNTAIIY